MSWSLNIGKVAGTVVRVHLTFLLFLAWIFAASYAAGGAATAWDSLIFMVLLFLCVLLHEFGHILMGRRFGIATRDVILSPIGGIARLEGMPERPRDEVLVALAGPAVTLALTLLLAGATWLTNGGFSLADLSPDSTALLPKLMAVNAWILIFNLLPIFPMDGGRVLRAVLASRYGLAEGTRKATRLSQLLAGGMVALGLFGANVLLVIIGGFIFLAGEAEARSVEIRTAGRGLTARQMMVTDFMVLKVYETLERAVQLLLAGEQSEFPVVDNLGHLEGMLTRNDIVRGLSSVGPGATVEGVMSKAVQPLPPDLDFDTALERLQQSGLPALPVVADGGQLAGLLTWDNVTDIVLVRRSLEARQRSLGSG